LEVKKRNQVSQETFRGGQLKLIRFGEPGQERPGVQLKDGSRINVSAMGSDYDERFFTDDGLKKLESWLKKNSASAPKVSPTTRLGPPICRPSKIVCIGLNYRDHAKETNAEPPKEPVLFFKSTTSLTGPNDSLVMPRNSTKVDWEVELAVIIGKRALYVEKKDAFDYVNQPVDYKSDLLANKFLSHDSWSL
jgi:2-keto-4-pentenoate hydratase/2-oxohepta-3-ene-1,7-dioic acid hydratase in catechol pathway